MAQFLDRKKFPTPESFANNGAGPQKKNAVEQVLDIHIDFLIRSATEFLQDQYSSGKITSAEHDVCLARLVVLHPNNSEFFREGNKQHS